LKREIFFSFIKDLFISIVITGIFYFIFKFFELRSSVLYLVLSILFITFLTFSFVTSLIVINLKNKVEYLNMQIDKLNKFDEITDVYKRNFLVEALNKYFDLAKRKNFPFSIMIIDIDDFKHINQTYGFEVGNKILKKIANELNKHIRGMDIIGRYDSDEFLIMSFIDKNEMYKFANRVKKIIENIEVEGFDGNINVSIGVAQKQGLDSLEDVLRKAYEAVILAKKKGGNRVDFLEHFLLIE